MYKINWEFEGGAFPLPNCITDDFIRLADPKWVKVIAYIFRHGNDCSYDINEMSAALGIGVNPDDVENALSYWEQVGVLKFNRNSGVKVQSSVSAANVSPTVSPITPIIPIIHEDTENTDIIKEITDISVSMEANPHLLKVSESRQRDRAVKSLTPKEIADRLEGSEQLRFLFMSAEGIFARVLTHTEHRTLIWLCDYYGMSADILLMIIAYCESANIASMSQVERIAKEWHEKGINNHDKAETEIKRMQLSGSLTGKIKTRLEINRGLTTKEKSFAADWSDKQLDIELIVHAYERTVRATGKLSFNYMNKILIGWYDNGYKTIEQIERDDALFASGKKTNKIRNPKTEHSYDLDEIIEHSINNIPKYKSKREKK